MASAYLSRTFGTPTNASKFTYSGWIKRSGLGGNQVLLYANGGNSQNFSNIMFNSGNNFFWHILHSNSEVSKLRTNAALRDTNAWYHLVFQYDSTQATANNRTKMYINGVEVTSYGTQTNSGQNSNYHMNTAVEHFIGAEKGNTGGSVGSYFDGQMAHVHFVDGTIYAPSTFGETDATTGIWKPKVSPTGITYGNNGFFLKFDNSGNMGLDSSGNSNNWTTSGTIIQTKDTPSNVFCTMNLLDFGVGSNNATLSLVNTKAVSGGSNWRHSHGALGFTSGKYYFEGKQGLNSDGDTGYVFGFCDQQYDTTDDPNSGTPNAKFYGRQGTTFYTPSGKTDNYFPGSSAGDILMVALDLDNNKIWFGTNGTWHNTNGSAGNTSYSSTTLNSSYPDATSVTIDTSKAGVYMPMIGSYNDGYIEANFGNGYFATTAVSSAQNPDDGVGIFEYDVPAGFRALCTKSLNAEEYS